MWNEETTKAFNLLKLAVTQIPVLNILDFSKPFLIETDALGTGIGVVLLQENKPIAFIS